MPFPTIGGSPTLSTGSGVGTDLDRGPVTSTTASLTDGANATGSTNRLPATGGGTGGWLIPLFGLGATAVGLSLRQVTRRPS